MFIVFTVLIVVTCIFTILIVLVQNSKGGGLASNFSSSNQYMGVRKTADFLEKATWTLGAALILFSLLAGITVPKAGKLTTPVWRVSLTRPCWINLKPLICPNLSGQNLPKAAKNKPKRT
jgi:protein translocase SecG subunit